MEAPRPSAAKTLVAASSGYRQVWARMITGLDGLVVPAPTAVALAAARRRIGPAPLAALFDLLRGPAAGPATKGAQITITTALRAARDQLIKAAGVVADTSVDLVGVIGQHVPQGLLPARHSRTTPRVVKRAISNYAPHTASGRHRGPSHRATISIYVLADSSP